ncbi:zinc finger CCCH domain-containing protein 6-like [Senna tora]|uniref:Zinc finger CCCH domain-containing protein 6-like n=1 Tax=Senna tora TaxID=362788 RepID=A0A834WML2_9FABA|nr:zinc finger CCCH domain-containing protein 6-like [Senna tora]
MTFDLNLRAFNKELVKLFLSEDCPSKVGQKSQDHLQAKTSSILPSSTNETYDLPPGFEGNHFLNQSKCELSHISQIKWKAPPLFVLRYNWQVAAGEESREKEDQKLREMRVLEAVYPRPSAIPPSPSVSLDVEEEDYDDNLTPVIPILPIEEEELMDSNPRLPTQSQTDTFAAVQPQSLHQYVPATNAPSSSQSFTPPTHASPGPSGMDADLAAASAVVTAIMKNNEQGSMIDMDLLVRILNDPLMIEKLIKDQNRTAATTVSVSSSNAVGILADSGLKPQTSSVPLLHTLDKTSSTSSFPLSGPMPGKLGTPSVPLPSHTTPDMHKPVNKTNHHVSNGVAPSLSAQPPQQDSIVASGVKRTASMASIASSEPSTVPLPSTGVNLLCVPNQVRPPATMAYHPSTGSAFSGMESHPVKDLSYYKSLIRQHGADGNDKQETQDSQIGIRQSNYKDLKPVHNIKPGEVNFKIQKPCFYFNTPRGCRNGSTCPYQHDMSTQWGSVNILGAQNAKRVKLGPEIKVRQREREGF